MKKTLSEIRDLYVEARNIVKKDDDQNRAVVIKNLTEIANHCLELYSEASSILEQAKCKNKHDALMNIVNLLKTCGVTDYRIKAFFGLIKSSVQAPSFEDIMKGNVNPTPHVDAVGKDKIDSKGPLRDNFDPLITFSDDEDDYDGGEKKSPSIAKKKAATKKEPAEVGDFAFDADENYDDFTSVADKKHDDPPTVEVTSPVDNVIEANSPDHDDDLPEDFNHTPQGNKFAPESLADFIGQEHIVKRILAEISAAKKQELRYIDHILLFGNRGLGKSTLMKLIAKELGVDFEFMDASQMGNDVRSQRAVQKFIKRISQERKPVVIAFDELHALPKHIQTGLLTLLNDRAYTYMDENGINHTLPIDEFTFIGATTDVQDVLPTLKDRCNNLTFYLKDYSREELAKIFINKFSSKGLTISDNALKTCIDRCRSSIREVDAYVNGLNTKAINADTTIITLKMAEEYFHDIDRDPIGLKSKDLEILEILYNNASGIMAEDTLAARVHLDSRILTKEFEPYLLKIGFINITSRGRSLTQKAIDYMKARETFQTEPSDAAIANEANVDTDSPASSSDETTEEKA